MFFSSTGVNTTTFLFSPPVFIGLGIIAFSICLLAAVRPVVKYSVAALLFLVALVGILTFSGVIDSKHIDYLRDMLRCRIEKKVQRALPTQNRP